MEKRRVGRPSQTGNKDSQAPAKPHYLTVVENLRKKILSGEWPGHSPLPPMRTLAKEFGVSLATVNYAMDVLKSESLVGSNLKRRLVVRGRTGAVLTPDNIILQVIPNMLSLERRRPDFRAMQDIIECDVARMYSPLLMANDTRFRSHFPQAFVDRPLRGIIVMGAVRQDVLKKYCTLNVPCVLVDQPPLGARLHSISVDNERSAMDAVETLVGLGHRRIALLRRVLSVHRDVDPDSKERTAGFRKGMKAAGLQAPRNAVFNFLSFDQAASPVMKGILNARPRFTAVLCVDLTCGRNFYMAAKAFGLRIPEDISILSFGSTDDPRNQISGPRIRFSELASHVAPLLKAPRRPVQPIRIPTVWFEGNTVAPR